MDCSILILTENEVRLFLDKTLPKIIEIMEKDEFKGGLIDIKGGRITVTPLAPAKNKVPV